MDGVNSTALVSVPAHLNSRNKQVLPKHASPIRYCHALSNDIWERPYIMAVQPYVEEFLATLKICLLSKRRRRSLNWQNAWKYIIGILWLSENSRGWAFVVSFSFCRTKQWQHPWLHRAWWGSQIRVLGTQWSKAVGVVQLRSLETKKMKTRALLGLLTATKFCGMWISMDVVPEKYKLFWL